MHAVHIIVVVDKRTYLESTQRIGEFIRHVRTATSVSTLIDKLKEVTGYTN